MDPRSALVRTAVVVLTAGTAVVAAPASATPGAPVLPAVHLGAPDLPETRTVSTVQPGVTLTRIVRGAGDGSGRWVVEVGIPPTATSPAPTAAPRSVQDEASARQHVTTLAGGSFPAEAQPVVQPAVADVAGGTIGHRVRLAEQFTSRGAADAAVAALLAAGFTGRSWYTGWDGDSTVAGPWTIDVVTIDPGTFRGDLLGTFGPDLQRRETTTELAALADASVAVNGGFFVLDPEAGAEGDPAGVGVYDGVLQSEPVGGRPALVFDRGGQDVDVLRPRWNGTLLTRNLSLELDGYNRVPGLIRNCGGTIDDTPTWRPLHDVTCTDPAELVAFSAAFGAATPAGPGTEVVLDGDGQITGIHAVRGVELADGHTSVQGTGPFGDALAGLAIGDRVEVRTELTGEYGAELDLGDRTVVNGGPVLVSDGQVHVTQLQDGMVRPGDPSFQYGWALQRSPRTFAGVDEQGRLLLVTVDGRQVDHLGVSIPEAAALARSMGMVEAVNLDGGGSTALSLGGRLISSPSDAAGERPVGDAIVVTAG